MRSPKVVVIMPAYNAGKRLEKTYREIPLDCVNECIVVELKAVDHLQSVCLAQVITYLKITGCPAALLMNFNCTSLRAGLRRLDHPDLYVKKSRG